MTTSFISSSAAFCEVFRMPAMLTVPYTPGPASANLQKLPRHVTREL